MKVIIPSDVTIDELEKLDPYYKGTHIEFNGQYYDHTRKINVRSVDGGEYELVQQKGVDATWSKLNANSVITAMHHYIVDTSYRFIASFITLNGNFICSLGERDLLTVYVSKSCSFFRSLPYAIKTTLKEDGMSVFDDYTKLKKIS